MLPAALPHPVDLAAHALNALTAREPWARDKLARHAGKRLLLVAGPWRAGFVIESDAALRRLEAEDGEPDVTLTLLLDRLRWPQPGAARSDTARPDPTEFTHISGDAALAQTVAELSQGLRWDVEDTLAGWIGDVPAVRLLAGVRRFGQGARDTLRRLSGNSAEYLAEEAGVILGSPALKQWQADRAETEGRLLALSVRADSVRRRLENLEARRRQGGRP